MNRVLESDELERVVIVAVNSAHIQAALKQALESDGVAQLIDSLFDSGLIDRFLAGLVDSGTLDRFFDRLLASEGLWHLIDEIAGEPRGDRRDLPAGPWLCRSGRRRGAGSFAQGRRLDGARRPAADRPAAEGAPGGT